MTRPRRCPGAGKIDDVTNEQPPETTRACCSPDEATGKTPASTGWRQRRDRFVALRAVSLPTSIVQRFFRIEGIRKAMLMAFNLFISTIPLIIIAFAYLSRLRRRISLSQVFIEQFHLHGQTASVISQAFPSTYNIIKVASIIAIVSFALGGFDVASVFQSTFADAWGVPRLRGWRGPARGAVWFVTVFATFGLSQILQRIPAKNGPAFYLVTVPIVMVMNYLFWLITPRLLLDNHLACRDLRPGALLGMLASTALWALSQIILPGWFTWYGTGFGGVGIALALLSWTYVVSIVWVVIVVTSAIMWERSAPIDDVVALIDPYTVGT